MRVIVTLTTVPHRIHLINDTIKSILDQTLQPNMIYINLPKIFNRHPEKTTFDIIPNFLINNLIKINYVDDIGPLTKLLPTLHYETDPNTILITIDDDIYYPKDLIDIGVKYLIHYDCLIASRCDFEEYKTSNSNSSSLPYCDSNLFEGFGGVFYFRKFLNNFNFEIIKNLPEYLFYSDDLYLSNYILNQNIPIKLILNDMTNNIKFLSYGSDEWALHLRKPVMFYNTKNNHFTNYYYSLIWLNNNNLLSTHLVYLIKKLDKILTSYYLI